MQSAPSRPCFCVQKFPTACSLLPSFLPGQRDTLSKMGRMMLLFALIGVATGQSSCDSWSACYSWVHGKSPCHVLTSKPLASVARPAMLIRVQYAILQRNIVVERYHQIRPWLRLPSSASISLCVRLSLSEVALLLFENLRIWPTNQIYSPAAVIALACHI
jgi:hypothetical protein